MGPAQERLAMLTMSSLRSRRNQRALKTPVLRGSARSIQTSCRLRLEQLDDRTAPAAFDWASTFGGPSAERVVAVSPTGDGTNLLLVQFQGTVAVPTTSGTANFTSNGDSVAPV